MLYPTINELTKGEFNRYELALGTAKCARIITDEYVKQSEAAEKAAAAGSKDSEKSAPVVVNKEYRDEKAVKNAINKIHSGEYVLVRKEETEEESVEAAEATEPAVSEETEVNN